MARSPRDSGFELIKWYLDCVSEEGEVFIGYSARLRWRAVSVHYSSSFQLRDGEPEETSSLRRSSQPVSEGAVLAWRCPSLQLNGKWSALEEPLEATVYDSELGAVEWQCLQPRASAEVESCGLGNMSGLGYAERLTLSVPPWRIPIRELHWGRFLSATDSLIWIDWRGEHSTQLVFSNGAPARASRLKETGLLLDDGTTLLLDDRKALRNGPLGGVLSRVPGLGSLVPGRIFDAREQKWRSRGVLRRPDGRRVTGWAIHEVVTWP